MRLHLHALSIFFGLSMDEGSFCVLNFLSQLIVIRFSFVAEYLFVLVYFFCHFFCKPSVFLCCDELFLCGDELNWFTLENIAFFPP